jgi:hypothetical protein
MDEVRLLTRMGGQIPDRPTSNGSVDYAKRSYATVPVIPSDSCSHGSSHHYSTNPYYTNFWNADGSRNTLRNALCSYAHKGTGKADAGAAGKCPRSPAGSHQEKARRAEQVRWMRCLEDVDGSAEDLVEAGAEASAGASETPTPPADGFHGCQGGGLTQLTDFHIMELLGVQHTRDTGIVRMLGPTDIHHTHRIDEYHTRQFP